MVEGNILFGSSCTRGERRLSTCENKIEGGDPVFLLGILKRIQQSKMTENNCTCEINWDVRCVCHPDGEHWKNCPVRVNTALWLIDNDETLYLSARERGDFTGIRDWFKNDNTSYQQVIVSYCNQMIDELCEEYRQQLAVQIRHCYDDSSPEEVLRAALAEEHSLARPLEMWIKLKPLKLKE